MGEVRPADTNANTFWDDKGHLIDSVGIPDGEGADPADECIVLWHTEDGAWQVSHLPRSVACYALGRMQHDDFVHGGPGIEESLLPPEPAND